MPTLQAARGCHAETTVKDNEVTADKGATAKKRTGKPLTLDKLAAMALDQVTQEQS